MFRFYKTIFNLKTRLQEQNLKIILIFFHYHLNLFICCKTKQKIKFMYYIMRINRIKFFEGGYKHLFETNNFFWKNKRDFVKIIYIFFLKM